MAMARRLRKPLVILLKQIIRILCKFAKGYKATRYAFCPKETGYFIMEDEALGTSCNALPTDVPKGHCDVYVGKEQRRFVSPATYFNNSLFQTLLEKAEEEYGFGHQMGLTLPCDEVAFEYLTSMFGKNDCAVPANWKLDEIMDFQTAIMD